MDTPPSAPLPLIAAYKAADGFLLSAIPEGLAIEGLDEALHDIEEVQKYGNPTLKLVGLTIGAVDNRTRLSKMLVSHINEHFQEYLLKPVIPRSTIIPTTQTNKKGTIFQAYPNHPVTRYFRELVQDFERRIENLFDIPLSTNRLDRVANE